MEILNENVEEITESETPIEEIPKRENPFCVISKATFGEYNVREIQTNSGWSANPYGKTYAVVPDDMVPAIRETQGFCDIILNEDGTEVVSFTAREIPEIPEQEPEPTAEERIATMEETIKTQQEEIAMLNDTLLEVLMG